MFISKKHAQNPNRICNYSAENDFANFEMKLKINHSVAFFR